MPVFPLEKNYDKGEFFSLSASDTQHLKKVLRVKLGEKFQVLLPNGQLALACLKENTPANQPKKIQGCILEYLEKRNPTMLPLHIAIGLIRWQRLEWLVEKLTELGVASLSLILSQYTRPFQNKELINSKINKLESISKETLKQCERSLPMKINPPLALKDFLETKQTPNIVKWVFLERKVNLARFSHQAIHDSKQYLLLIGPEGGFSSEETQQILEKNFTAYQLGENILRSETAAIYATSILHSFLSTG